jgi:hypothetical protein
MREIVKLKALRDGVSYCLNTFAHGGAAIFDPKNVEDLFERYESLSYVLREKYHPSFDDLPDRDFNPRKTTDFEGRGYFTREQMQVLLMDIDYCINLLSQSTTVDIPSMKVTREGLFFSGQYFDAIQRVREILANAQKNITIIDSYIDQRILDIITSKKPNVAVVILTKDVTPALKAAAIAFNKQYGGLSIRKSLAFHDRFIIIDDSDFYHFGASIKDLGNRGFMFSRIEEAEIVKSLLDRFALEWAKAQIEV